VLGVICTVALLWLVTCLSILTVVIFCVLLVMFSCVWCDTLLDMQYDVLLVFVDAVYLRMYIPWIAVCWS